MGGDVSGMPDWTFTDPFSPCLYSAMQCGHCSSLAWHDCVTAEHTSPGAKAHNNPASHHPSVPKWCRHPELLGLRDHPGGEWGTEREYDRIMTSAHGFDSKSIIFAATQIASWICEGSLVKTLSLEVWKQSPRWPVMAHTNQRGALRWAGHRGLRQL